MQGMPPQKIQLLEELEEHWEEEEEEKISLNNFIKLKKIYSF